MEQIPEIQRLINEAVEKADHAETSLNQAKTSADHALTKAINASKLAKEASEISDKLSEHAINLNRNATKLKDEAELMADRVKNTENEFNEIKENVQVNSSLINDAKAKVSLIFSSLFLIMPFVERMYCYTLQNLIFVFIM